MDVAACIGLMFILKYGSILNWVRVPLVKLNFFRELFECSLCLGFWSGVIISMISFHLTGVVTFNIVVLPLVSAAACWVADPIVAILQYTEIKLENTYTS